MENDEQSPLIDRLLRPLLHQVVLAVKDLLRHLASTSTKRVLRIFCWDLHRTDQIVGSASGVVPRQASRHQVAFGLFSCSAKMKHELLFCFEAAFVMGLFVLYTLHTHLCANCRRCSYRLSRHVRFGQAVDHPISARSLILANGEPGRTRQGLTTEREQDGSKSRYRPSSRKSYSRRRCIFGGITHRLLAKFEISDPMQRKLLLEPLVELDQASRHAHASILVKRHPELTLWRHEELTQGAAATLTMAPA